MADESPCPKCGRPAKGLCIDCFLEDNPVTLKDFRLEYCDCGLVFVHGVWRDDVDKAVKELVASKLRYPLELDKPMAWVEYVLWGKHAKIHVHVAALYLGNKVERDYEWNIPVAKRICPDCVKLSSGYFEAVLQVRAEDFDKNWLDAGKIANVEPVAGGHDIYLIDNGYAKRLSQSLSEKGYLVTHSSSLYGKKDGRDVYRNFYSIKRPEFKKGDFIKLDGIVYRVLEAGAKASLYNILSHAKTSKKLSRLSDAEILAPSSDAHQALVTEVRPDGIQVMDSETYGLFEFKNKGFSQGDEVEIIKIEGKNYLLPKVDKSGVYGG
ncbi:MAG TPA: hypothetical protein ENN13_03710 [Candidatus Altiarchaeales archaeon]|nr:hypothetical protein [Candidatus Altiarchaeales archaeon]